MVVKKRQKTKGKTKRQKPRTHPHPKHLGPTPLHYTTLHYTTLLYTPLTPRQVRTPTTFLSSFPTATSTPQYQNTKTPHYLAASSRGRWICEQGDGPTLAFCSLIFPPQGDVDRCEARNMAYLWSIVLCMAAVASADFVIEPSNSSASLFKTQLKITSPVNLSLPTSYEIAPITPATGQGQSQAAVDVRIPVAMAVLEIQTN